MGLGIQVTTVVINEHRKEEGKTHVGTDTVWRTIHRLKPVVKRTPTASQGSHDAHAAWTIARKNWIAQLLIRIGELTDDQVNSLKVNGELPEYFDKTKLTELKLEQIAWFDKTHKKVIIGMGSDYQTKFPRDKDGNLDPDGDVRIECSYESKVSGGSSGNAWGRD